MNLNDKCHAILLAAFHQFSEKGYHAAKMIDISRRAGVGKGTLYEYFSNKEALLFAVLEYKLDSFINKLIDSSNQSQTYWEKVYNLLTLNQELTKADQNFAQLVINHFGLVNKELNQLLKKKHQQFEEYVSDIIEGGIEQGEFRPVPIHLATRVVISFLHPHHHEEGKLSEEELEQLLDILGNGLAGK